MEFFLIEEGLLLSASIWVRTEINVQIESTGIRNFLGKAVNMWTLDQNYFQSRRHCKLLCISSYPVYLIGNEWIVYILIIFFFCVCVNYCVQLSTVIWLYIFIIILRVMIKICVKVNLHLSMPWSAVWDCKLNLYSDDEFIVAFSCSPRIYKFFAVRNYILYC